MIIKHKNGNTTTVEVGDSLRGLRVVNITLDAVDLYNLSELARKDELLGFIHTLRCAAVKLKPFTNFIPIDADNDALKRQSKDYLCMATFKQQ